MLRRFIHLMLTLLLVLAMALPALAADKLLMATTTSTDNTGLLDELAPEFEKETGIALRWSAMGTGKALKTGGSCDVDVLLVHAPAAEKKFIEEGKGKERTEIMYNDFVIIGPPSDPAGVKGMSVVEAMGTIAEKKAAFASRGDDSGTHKKEKSLWKEAGMDVPDKEAWYVQTGQGMIKTIGVAAEKDAYVMTDRGTYIKYSDTHDGNPPLKVLVEGDKVLFNQYSVLTLSPENCPEVKHDLAAKFVEWMASPSTQEKIKNFRLLGQPLFIPNAK